MTSINQLKKISARSLQVFAISVCPWLLAEERPEPGGAIGRFASVDRECSTSSENSQSTSRPPKGASRYQWGRDAGYFDKIEGFARKSAGHFRFVATQKPGAKISSVLDRELPPGTYRVLLRSHNVSDGLNTFKVTLNGSSIILNSEGGPKADNRYFLAGDVVTTESGKDLSVIVEKAGQCEARIYSVWISDNPYDIGTIRKGVETADRPAPANPKNGGNIMPCSSFEIGLNDFWGKTLGAREFINDQDIKTMAGAPDGKRCLALYYWRTPVTTRYNSILCHRPLSIDFGGNLAFSAYFKSFQGKATVRVILKSAARNGRQEEETANFTVDENWKRYSHVFKLPAEFTGTVQVVTQVLNASFQGLDDSHRNIPVFMDAVQLEQGDDATSYSPAFLSEAGLLINNQPGALYYHNEPREAIIAATGPPTDVKVTIFDQNRLPVSEHIYRVECENGSGEKKIKLDAPTLGTYSASIVSLHENAAPTRQKVFAVMKAIPASIPFQDVRGAVYGGISPKSVKTFHKSGLRMSNSLSVFRSLGRMSMIMPRKDVFNPVDEVVDYACDAGISIVVCMGNRYPAWALEPGKTYPSLAAWKEFVTRMANHYKGRIKYWMLPDEPSTGSSGSIPAEQLYEMAKATRRIVKAVDPANQVVIHSDTEDYFKKELEVAGDDTSFYDIIAAGANLVSASRYQASESLKLGKNVWAITFMSKTSAYESKPSGRKSAQWSRHICEAFSLLKATKFMNYSARIAGPNPADYAASKSMFEFDGALRPAGINYAATCEILRGTNAAGKLELPRGVQCHLFQKGERVTAVLWILDKAARCQLPKTENMKLLDFNGDEIPFEMDGDRETFMVCGAPVFLSGDQTLPDAIKKMRVANGLAISGAIEPVDESRQIFAIRFVNHTNKPVSGLFSFLLKKSWFCVLGNRDDLLAPKQIELKPHGQYRFDLPILKHAKYPLEGYEIEVNLYTRDIPALTAVLPITETYVSEGTK